MIENIATLQMLVEYSTKPFSAPSTDTQYKMKI